MGNNESSQITRASRDSDNTSIYNPDSDYKEDRLTMTRGDGEGRVYGEGKKVVASAETSKGGAFVSTDGERVKAGVKGDGKVIYGNGVAYASSGRSNQAIAYSSKVAAKANEGGDGMRVLEDGGKKGKYLGF